MKKAALLAALTFALASPGFAQMAGQSGRPGTPGTPGGTDTPGATMPGSTSRPAGNTGATGAEPAAGAQASGNMKSTKTAAKSMTATGCISQKDGKYMLMGSQHPDGLELMTSENLKPHVGHTVTVTGTMDKGSMGSMDSMSGMDMGGSKSDSMKGGSGMGMEHGSGSGMNMEHGSGSMSMKVTSMKMVSGTCTSGSGAGSKKPTE